MIPVIDKPGKVSNKVLRTRIRRENTMKSQNVSGMVSENKEEKTLTFQGRDVTIVRSVNNGDHGWDANKDQVVINDGGTEKTVLRSEVVDQQAAGHGDQSLVRGIVSLTDQANSQHRQPGQQPTDQTNPQHRQPGQRPA